MEHVFNPLEEDFTVTYDIHGTSVPESYTIKAGETQGFVPVVAQHVKKHLANKLILVREIKFPTEEERHAIIRELTV